MRFSSRLLIRISVYFLYALVLTAVLLIVRFPHEKLRVYLTDLAESSFPEARFEIESIGFQFPAGLKVRDFLVKSPADSKQILKLDHIIVQPQWKSPVSQFSLKINGYEQEHAVHLVLDWKNRQVLVRDFKINKLDLGRFEYIHKRLGRDLSGLMNISGAFSNSSDNDLTDTGKGEIAITGAKLQLLLPILFQDVINFKKIEVEFSFKDKTIEFVNGRFNGNQFKGEFAGQAQLLQQFISTRLNLKGRLIPQAEVLKNNPQATVDVNRLKRQFNSPAFPFVIEGEVGKPVFGFGNWATGGKE